MENVGVLELLVTVAVVLGPGVVGLGPGLVVLGPIVDIGVDPVVAAVEGLDVVGGSGGPVVTTVNRLVVPVVEVVIGGPV